MIPQIEHKNSRDLNGNDIKWRPIQIRDISNPIVGDGMPLFMIVFLGVIFTLIYYFLMVVNQ
jgi:hypothetical protein